MNKQGIPFYSIFSHSFFILMILLSLFIFNKCKCPDNKPFQKDDDCYSSCNNNELFITQTCIPVSTKEENITNMVDQIIEYYQLTSTSVQDFLNIGGDIINYQIISKNYLATNSDNENSINLTIGDTCFNKIQNILTDFYIILIHIIEEDYLTSENGIIIFDLTNTERYLIGDICDKEKINFGIPFIPTDDELKSYNQIKKNYGYDIFNIDDSFYADKCTKFTTSIKTDLTLEKRFEIYGEKVKNLCSDICTYEKFDENENRTYCNCIVGGTKKEEIKIKSDSINYKVIKCLNKLGKDIIKNYGFFIMTILSFLFLLCVIISFIKLSPTISRYSKDKKKKIKK